MGEKQMQIFDYKNSNIHILIAAVVSLIVVGSAVQAIMNPDSSPLFKRSYETSNQMAVSLRGESTFEWSDEFVDSSKIDDVLSSQYVLENGTITMMNTYAAWESYPEWQRMKPVEVTNAGDETIYDYVLELTIPYDNDMQIDFDDIRFADENSDPLTYWIDELIWGSSAKILVRIPELAAQQTTILYMFYGNPAVEDESDETIFSWLEITDEDLRLSWTLQTEGAWDPAVAYGGGKFLTS